MDIFDKKIRELESMKDRVNLLKRQIKNANTFITCLSNKRRDNCLEISYYLRNPDDYSDSVSTLIPLNQEVIAIISQMVEDQNRAWQMEIDNIMESVGEVTT